jgi:hypothetical protein
MSATPETDKLWDAQVISDTPYHEALKEMRDHASELEHKFMVLLDAYALQTHSLAEAIKSHDEVSSQLEKLQQSILDLSHPNCKLLLEERNEAVNNYETAVLREHRMQEQRDELVEAVREAWFIMDDVDEIDGIDRMIDWQNKYTKYAYE